MVWTTTATEKKIIEWMDFEEANGKQIWDISIPTIDHSK